MDPLLPPFVAALGETLDHAAPVVRRHLALPDGKALHEGGLRLPLPRLLAGSARTREWEEPDGRLGLSLTLHHQVFGDYAGYEAVMTPGDPS